MLGMGSGPLAGLRVVEFVGLGPGPHCAMLLSDLGADVVRIDRPGGIGHANPVMERGRTSLTIDLRAPGGIALCRSLLCQADALIEGFRPGVMERNGLGPEVVMNDNPRLVYGRMTGWGQTGPLAKTAGHDINYIAMTGALAAIGRPGEPAQPPLNLVGDFGGGSLFLALGIVAAIWERERSGLGQVVDAAIVDGVSSLMTMFSGATTAGLSTDRARNVLGGAAPFYRCYVCADGREIAVGAIEPQFYAELMRLIDVPADIAARNPDPATWAELSRQLAAIFATRTCADWCAVLEGTDACFAPVLELSEVPDHPHNRARDSFILVDGRVQAVPAPRFSRTPGAIQPSHRIEAAQAVWGVQCMPDARGCLVAG